MLLEVLVVAVAAAVIGATLALIWTERDRGDHRPDRRRRDPPWTAPDQPTTGPPSIGFDPDHQPGQGLLWRPPQKTRHPRRPDHELANMSCEMDAHLYCIDGVEYEGSCSLSEHIFPPGSKVQQGGCS